MSEAGVPELPNILGLLSARFPGNSFLKFIYHWENVSFSLIIVLVLSGFFFLACRKRSIVPARMQALAELIVGGMDSFVCGIMGPRGRKFTPFIGTLFIYILAMNLSGLIPFMKASTSSWSTTLALALCVFCYVQYTAIKELGFLGYLDHLAGKQRGALAFTIIMPLFMLVLLAMGIPHEFAHGSLRFSFGKKNTDSDVKKVIALLPGIVRQLRSMSPLWPENS